MLVVNTGTRASAGILRSTYQQLEVEEVSSERKEKNFHVLGVPRNQFGAQDLEAGSNEEIADFCTLNYKTSFPPLREN